MIRSEIIMGGAEATSSAENPRLTPLQERRSSPYLTKYEVARVIGERARQVVNGTSVFLQVQCNGGGGATAASTAERNTLELAERCSDPHSFVVDPVYIAKVDLLQGRIPMIVRRTWPDGRTENIPVSELLVDRVMLNIQN